MDATERARDGVLFVAVLYSDRCRRFMLAVFPNGHKPWPPRVEVCAHCGADDAELYGGVLFTAN